MAQIATGTVLVTGATGFAGRAVIPLLQAAGWQVRASGRAASRCPAGCDFIAADLDRSPDWDALTRGMDAVVHLAARVHVMRDNAADPLAAFRAANVTVTERLAEAALRQGARHFLFASSVKVNGERTPVRPFNEQDPPRPEDPYGVSKLEAERVLAKTGLGVTILRPPLMYGPGVKGNFERLLRWVERGIPLPLGAVKNRRSLLYVGNFGSAVAAALEQPAKATRTYLLSDGEDVSTSELIRRMARALGRQPRLVPVPVALLRAGAKAARLEAELQRLTESLSVDIGCIRRELAWSPPHTLDQGLALMLAAERRA